MTNNMDISYEETVDPRGLNCGPEDYLDPGCSRDPERTPMQWTPTGGDAAGFTRDGADPWLPINSVFLFFPLLYSVREMDRLDFRRTSKQ